MLWLKFSRLGYHIQQVMDVMTILSFGIKGNLPIKINFVTFVTHL